LISRRIAVFLPFSSTIYLAFAISLPLKNYTTGLLYSPAYVLADYIGIRGSQYLIHDRLDWYDVLGVYGQEIQYCGGVTPKRNSLSFEERLSG
jgi:hypothetical protein